MTLLLGALSEEARACLGEHRLLTVDFENVAQGDPEGAQVDVTRLKSSSRVSFLKASLRNDSGILFSARAIYKALPSGN
tara:strand:+ start:179785 stop:180021 length:237 start_codon:yes stop_codon:yes gene_type:complete